MSILIILTNPGLNWMPINGCVFDENIHQT